MTVSHDEGRGSGVRVVVTGGRDFSDVTAVNRALSAVHRKHGIVAIIQGGARGADFLCASWANANGVPTEDYPANWQRFGKRAGILRNQQMIDEGKPDVAVAFPGGRGTADMVSRLTAAGIPVWRPMTRVLSGPTGEIVIFIREEGFYPVQLSGTKPTADEVPEHVALNPGTKRVLDMAGNVLWPPESVN